MRKVVSLPPSQNLMVLLLILGNSFAAAQEDGPPKKPTAAAQLFEVPEDLRIDLVLSEPLIAQPVFCNFDERGRLWVVEYRQYPNPAGLKVLSKDQYYRSVYDKVPQAPPNHVAGKDRISIHEDTDGDGKFDHHKVFVDGLNIVTSVARGRGGVWVLNPPYLLFYPDADNDDVPDSDPEVHLAGFGLEDTHSCTNSLRWGPDGWLYAAQGSTVTGNIVRPGLDEKPKRSMGQLIWRYHPGKRIYEIFAEGGGNAFGVEIDSAGRFFSGHNGGNTRGFHYPQGGYLRKGFTKHGALSNPFAFGFFPHMKHPNVERFTHNFVIYEAEALPAKYHGQLFGIEPLQGRVVQSEIEPRGSTFETQDINRVVTTTDKWFCPVDIKLGPDGGIYICDWYDDNVSHLEASVGKTDKEDGRIYRLTGKSAPPLKPFDLAKLPDAKLIETLKHPNRWFRQTALRLIGDRQPKSVVPKLERWVRESDGQLALESLWALHLIVDEQFPSLVEKLDLLKHPNPHVRKWTVRLLGDARQFPVDLKSLAATETAPVVRIQVASTAKRMRDASEALKLIGLLLNHQSGAADPYEPLLVWWAIESKCDDHNAIVEFTLQTADFWLNPYVTEHLVDRLARRFALAGKQRDFETLNLLLQDAHRANPEAAQIMLKSIRTASRTTTSLTFPDALIQTISKLGGDSLELQVRQQNRDAIMKAVAELRVFTRKQIGKEDEQLKSADSVAIVRLVRALGEIRERSAVDPFLKMVAQKLPARIQIAALEALQRYSDPRIGNTITGSWDKFQPSVREVAESVLVTRIPWTLQLLEAVATKQIQPGSISPLTVRRMLFHDDTALQMKVTDLFGQIEGATDERTRQTINVVFNELESMAGSPYEGKKLFANLCGKCHRLYQDGGDIGPDLTGYQRTNVKSMLLHIVNPSAEIREGYENILFALDDGTVVNGFVQDEDERQVVLRTAAGSVLRIEKESIENRKSVSHSLMPSGLLDELTAQQRRDLFAYLRSTQPLNN